MTEKKSWRAHHASTSRRFFDRETLAQTHFFKSHLALFILIFAAIGGYIIYASLAAGPANTIYVSLTGNDATCVINNAAKPCATLSKALSLASPGDTVSMADGQWLAQTVSGKTFASNVTISGSRSAIIDGFTFTGSSFITLSGVTIEPPSGSTTQAKVQTVSNSHDIIFDNVNMDGRDITAGTSFNSDTTVNNLTLQNSIITQCGEGNKCVGFGASNFKILHNNFQVCEQCTWMKGSGNGATISGNNFGPLYIAPGCTNQTCIHLDGLFIMGGGPWTITDNTWQDCGHGPYGDGDCTAQIFLNTVGSSQIHDVLIENNIYEGHTNMAIRLNGNTTPLPTNISVINNTVMSAGGSIYLDSATWGGQPSNLQPIVANNIEAQALGTVCSNAQHFANLVVSGTSCTGDTSGNPNLDANNAPTANSTLVINKANATYAPSTDYFGNSRVGAPDIGAIEYGGTHAPPTDNIPPNVSITNPVNGQNISGTYVVSANASDNVGVTGVQFMIDGTNLGPQEVSQPYNISWDTTKVSNGTHTVTAVARDAAGNTTTATLVSVTVKNTSPPPPDNIPPTVSVTLPANGATVSATTQLTANASDNVGVVLVQFMLDGTTPINSAVTISPYQTNWDTSSTPNGSHTIMATAKDAAGNVGTSAVISITVNNTPAPPDQTPPSVPTGLNASNITASSADLAWNASTDDPGGSGVAGYNLYRNGNLIATTTGLSFSDSGLIASMTYGYSVTSVDNAGNESAQSPVVNVTTAPGPPPPFGVDGDVNFDGHVDIQDLSLLLTHFGQNYPPADFDESGTVDIADLSTLLTNFGR